MAPGDSNVVTGPISEKERSDLEKLTQQAIVRVAGVSPVFLRTHTLRN